MIYVTIYDRGERMRQAFAELLYECGEPFAAGYYENPDKSPFFRYACAQRRFWEHVPLPEYISGALYPCGYKWQGTYGVSPSYSYTVQFNHALIQEKLTEQANTLLTEMDNLRLLDTPHTVGGNGYTHSMPNYGRVVYEGLDAYALRVEALKPGDFRDGLTEVLTGIRAYHARALSYLEDRKAEPRLISALRRVPFLPAQNLYEGLVCWNFIYYIDGCDNPGRLDAELWPLYRGEDVTHELRQFFCNVDANDGWSSALGPDCNDLTLQMLRAVKGLRRPSLELRVTRHTPDSIWDAATEALETGCGQPALYNEEAYQASLSKLFPEIAKDDLLRFNGGGCTETMLAGVSNVGSLDAGINLPLILSGRLERLDEYPLFEAFYHAVIEDIAAACTQVFREISDYQRRRAEHRPQPVRTLLVDDCIDRGRDFNAGGARYYWSVVNLAGLVNVIDSLLAVRELVYETKQFTPRVFLASLKEQREDFLLRLKRCRCYGVDDGNADALARDLASRIFNLFDTARPWLGGRFLPASIQFVTYLDAGRGVPATPDGRTDGAPLADSIGAVHGKDTRGPTAMLNSAAALPLSRAAGTPVLNLRLQKGMLRSSLRGLTEGYFAKGGMQLQISCLSREDIHDAMLHPELHGNLIVRIGGYAEYFNRLSPELQKTVAARTEYDEP